MSAAPDKHRPSAFGSLALVAIACTMPTGCLVAGVSSGGGFFIWPGSIGLLVVFLIIYFIARRR